MTQILLVFNVSSCLTATNNFVFFIISLFSFFGLFPRSLNCIIRLSATRALTFNFSFATFYISLDKVTHSIRCLMIPISKQNVSTRQSYIFRERLVWLIRRAKDIMMYGFYFVDGYSLSRLR